MKKVLCGMAMGMMVSVLACKLIKKSSVCEDMVDDLMEKKNKMIKGMKKIIDK
jgi:hypothetical protein